VHIRELTEDKLTGEQKQNLALAQAIAGSKVVPAEFHDGGIIGAYDLISDRIYVHPIRFSSLPATVSTITHELAHRRSKRPDEAPEFKKALRSVMIEVTRRVREGEFDELL